MGFRSCVPLYESVLVWIRPLQDLRIFSHWIKDLFLGTEWWCDDCDVVRFRASGRFFLAHQVWRVFHFQGRRCPVSGLTASEMKVPLRPPRGFTTESWSHTCTSWTDFLEVSQPEMIDQPLTGMQIMVDYGLHTGNPHTISCIVSINIWHFCKFPINEVQSAVKPSWNTQNMELDHPPFENNLKTSENVAGRTLGRRLTLSGGGNSRSLRRRSSLNLSWGSGTWFVQFIVIALVRLEAHEHRYVSTPCKT